MVYGFGQSSQIKITKNYLKNGEHPLESDKYK